MSNPDRHKLAAFVLRVESQFVETLDGRLTPDIDDISKGLVFSLMRFGLSGSSWKQGYGL